tara:strand:+ start:1019 stop:3079 length:2061 start_codon:yes stop_codon:yes gene_type:complete
MDFINLRKLFQVALTCWSLVLTSMPLSVMAQTTNNKPMSAADCPTGQGSAYQWNSSLNRCMLKNEASAQREMFEDCDGLQAEAKAACFERMRNQNLNEQAVASCKKAHPANTQALKECMQRIDGSSSGMAEKNKGSGALGVLGMTVSGASTAFVVAGMLSKQGKKAKGCTSATMFKFTSIGAIGGQLYLKLGAKGEFDELQKNYDEQVASGDDAQFASYDYLEAQQREVASVAKKHETVYKMTALAYGATALVAGLELTGIAGMKPCTGENSAESTDESNTTGNENDEVTTNENGEDRIHGSDVEERQFGSASSADKTNATATDAVEKTGMFGKIGNFLGTSVGILAVSAAGGLINSFLMNKAADQKDEANENAETVANLKAKIQASLAGSSYCKSRDDLSVPRCYCYKADNSRNTERTRSETCQALWANQDRNLFAKAGQYGKDKAGKPLGCYTVEGKWDPDCKCAKMKNDQGQNACLQVPVGVNQIAALGPGTGLGNVIDSMNKVYSGGFASGSIAPAQLGSLAARVGAARKQVEANINQMNNKNGQPSIDTQADAILKGMIKSVTPAQLASADASLGALSGSNTPLSPALQAAINKSGISIASINRASPGRRKSAPKKKAGFDLYGADQKTGSSAAYMEKKYDYSKAQNDIVERDDVSIWQVISNRYTTSGLRRLFDDESEGL